MSTKKLQLINSSFISYNEQVLTDEQKAQARENIETDYATDQEIIAMMIEEGIIEAESTESSLLVDETGNGVLTNSELIVDENNAGTTDVDIVVDEDGNGVI